MSVLGILGVAVLVTACAGESGTGDETSSSPGNSDWSSIEPIELTVSNVFPDTSVSSIVLTDWMDAVTEMTDGVVTFDYYPGGTLHPLLESLSALNTDLTDITFIGNSYFPDQLPISNWYDQVLQASLQDVGFPLVNIAGTGQQFTQPNEASVEERAEAGFVQVLPLVGAPALSCVDEFESESDLEGRQARVSGPIAQGEVGALGMGGVFTPTTEQYEALQRGVLDCAVNSPTTIISSSLLEVTPWVTVPTFAPLLGSSWVISTSAWEELAPEIQEVMNEARFDVMTKWIKASLEEFKALGEDADEVGGGVVDSASINDALNEWWADQPDLASTAPSSVTDPQAVMDAVAEGTEEWVAFSTDVLGVPSEPESIGDALAEGDGVVQDWQQWRDKLAEGPAIG